MRVMLAASDNRLSFPICFHLIQNGCQIDTAYDGLECLTKLKQSPPDTLILSEGLLWGNADGIVACLRENEPLSSIPVVLILNQPDSDMTIAWVDTPVVTSLPKPIHPSELPDFLSSLSACLLSCEAAKTEIAATSLR